MLVSAETVVTTLKRCTIVRSVPIDPDEAYDLAETRREYIRADVWDAIAHEVRSGRYVLEVWDASSDTCYEYGVRFVRVAE